MAHKNEFSGRDETLASGLYTEVSVVTRVPLFITHFGYTIRTDASSIVSEVAEAFGAVLSRPLSATHLALLAGEAEQSQEDIALAHRMRRVMNGGSS